MEPKDALCDGLRASIVAALQEGGPALVAAATTELRARVQAFLEEEKEEHGHGDAAQTSSTPAAAVVVRALARALGRGVGELREAYATARAERGGVDPTTGLAPGLALVRGLQCQALLRLQLGALMHGRDPLPEKVVGRARRYLADLQLRQTTSTLGTGAGEGKASGGGGAAALEGAQWETVGGDDGVGDDEGLLLSQESAKRGPAAEMDASFEAFLAKGVLAAFGRTHPKSCLTLYASLECDPPAELLALAEPDATTTAAAAQDAMQQQQEEEEQPPSTARRGPVFHLRAQEREQAQAIGFISAYAEREVQRKQRGEQGSAEGQGKGEPVVEPAAPAPPPQQQQQQQQQQAKQQKRVLGRSASLPVTLGGGGGGSLLAQAAAAGGKRGGGSRYQVHVKTYRNPNVLAQSRRPAPLARTASIAAAGAMPLQPLPGALNRSASSVAALSSSAASLTLAAAAGPPSAAAAGIIKKRAPATASGADPGQRLLAKRLRPAAAATTTSAAAAASTAGASGVAVPFPPGSPRASAVGGFASPVGNKARRTALAASDTVLGTPPPSMSKHKGGGADEALVIAGTPDQPPARRRVGGGVFGLGTGRMH